MLRLSTIAVSLLLACGSSPKPAAPSPATDSTASSSTTPTASKSSDLDGFRDQMCGCKAKSGDRAIRQDCAERVEASRKDAMGKQGATPSSTETESEKQFNTCRDEIRKDYDAMKAGK